MDDPADAVLCAKCGKAISNEDIDALNLTIVDDDTVICAACQPPAGDVARRSGGSDAKPPAGRDVSRAAAPPQPKPAAPAAAPATAAPAPERPKVYEDEPPPSPWRVWILPLVLGAATVVFLVVLLFSGGSQPPPKKASKADQTARATEEPAFAIRQRPSAAQIGPAAPQPADPSPTPQSVQPAQLGQPATPGQAVAAPPKPDGPPPAPAPVGRYKECPLVRVPVPRLEPKIDGDLSDEAWRGATPLALAVSDGSAAKPTCDATAMVLADSKRLYIAFKCIEPRMSELVASQRERDTEVWEDDDVEVFLLHGSDSAQPYYQIILNARASRYDAYNKSTLWNPQFDAAVKVEKDFWAVELAVPWAALSEHKGVPSKLWRMNLNRTRRANTPTGESLAWSPTGCDSFHIPDRFGFATFDALPGSVPDDLLK